MSQQKKINQLKNQIDHLTSRCDSMRKTCTAHDKAKEMLKRVREENAELKARVAELERYKEFHRLVCTVTATNFIKAGAIREAMDSTGYSCETATGDDAFSRTALDDYADKIERGES